MFSTAKEVHVYIDGAIQVLSSNRKQSIAPQLLDMFLNNAAIEYISSKFPNGYNAKDIEGTLKRYTDFSNLKSAFKTTPVVSSDNLYSTVKVVKPYNAIKIQDVVCSYIRPFEETNKTVGVKNVGIFEINDNVRTANSLHISIGITALNGDVKTVELSLSDLVSAVKSNAGMFYFYDYLVDILRNTYKLNVKYDSTGTNGNRLITIEPSVGDIITKLESNSNYIFPRIISSQVTVPVGISSKVAPCSIYQDADAKIARADFYRSKNLHLDPVAEINDDGISIYYTDFLPNSVIVNFLRKPKLFNIATGQVPEINITKDFLDFAVKEISLVVNSPSYDRIVNETIKNS